MKTLEKLSRAYECAKYLVADAKDDFLNAKEHLDIVTDIKKQRFQDLQDALKNESD